MWFLYLILPIGTWIIEQLLSIRAISLRECLRIALYEHINAGTIPEYVFKITAWLKLAEEHQVYLLQGCTDFPWIKKAVTGPLSLRTVSASEMRVDLIILIRYGAQTIFLS